MSPPIVFFLVGLLTGATIMFLLARRAAERARAHASYAAKCADATAKMLLQSSLTREIADTQALVATQRLPRAARR